VGQKKLHRFFIAINFVYPQPIFMIVGTCTVVHSRKFSTGRCI